MPADPFFRASEPTDVASDRWAIQRVSELGASWTPFLVSYCFYLKFPRRPQTVSARLESLKAEMTTMMIQFVHATTPTTSVS